MREVMYDINSVVIAAVLFASMAIAIEVGYHLGRKIEVRASESSKAHVTGIQASLLGVLALLLGFTFSISLQRFDNRSAAVVDEANAIGTAELRADLLPASVRGDVQKLLNDYIGLRIQTGAVNMVHENERNELLEKSELLHAALWRLAVQAANDDPRPVTSGLFIQALNEMIDSYGRRDAALNRHVPEVVLFLLYSTFLMTGIIVGYASGLTGHRASFVTYIMIGLIVLLAFIIIDLDRPRRGLIEVNQQSLINLQAAFNKKQPVIARLPTRDQQAQAPSFGHYEILPAEPANTD